MSKELRLPVTEYTLAGPGGSQKIKLSLVVEVENLAEEAVPKRGRPKVERDDNIPEVRDEEPDTEIEGVRPLRPSETLHNMIKSQSKAFGG